MERIFIVKSRVIFSYSYEFLILIRTSTNFSKESKVGFKRWAAHDDAQLNFCKIDDDSSEDSEYVDLLLNPERYTGYAGPSAHRIWRTIYQENCFK